MVGGKSVTITMDNVLAELQRSVPSFHSEWQDKDTTYLAFGDFRRFTCSEAEVLQFVDNDEEAAELSHAKECMALIESLFCNGDQEVHDLFLDCLEGLTTCPWLTKLKRYFGPKTSATWAQHFSKFEQ
jgi:hypothetical protein